MQTDRVVSVSGAETYNVPAPAAAFANLRVAIVHYWFLGRAGGERVVEALGDIFPQADLFSLIADPEVLGPNLRERRLTTSFLQRIPGIRKFHRHTLMLQPLALEQFDLRGYDLILSSESGPAKGVMTSPGSLHVCYCHSPMRYIWDLYPGYIAEMSSITRPIFALTAHRLRQWDYATAARVDAFVCNSQYVASRIRKFYRRDATVIYPPVEVKAAEVSSEVEDYYLAAGRLVGYKRFDLAVAACNALGRRLKVIGNGPDMEKLRRMAGRGVEFLGSVSEAEKNRAFARCRALLFPGEEDFGMVPVEAQAHGRPVVALGSGGVLETVRGLEDEGCTRVAQPTGVLFAEPTADALADAIQRFEANEDRFDPEAIRSHVLPFDVAEFRTRMTMYLERALEEHQGRNAIQRVACLA